MRLSLKAMALAGLALLPFAASPARAQTAEGTTITNTATASWTDANSNTYTPVTANVSVTVGFAAGVDVTGTASVTPAAGSTGNEITFAVQNTGNGTDSVSVSHTVGTGVTVTSYKIGATTYATLTALNEALAATAVAQGGSVSVVVVYSVAAGTGGQTIPVAVTATSRRDNTKSDTYTTNVQPPVTGGVNVSPDGDTESKLPNSTTVTSYTKTFTVQNNGSSSDNLALSATTDNGAVMTIVSVNGVSGSTATLSAVAAGASQDVDVVYSIASGAAAGATPKLTLTATSGNDNTKTDTGDLTVTVIRAAITMTKQAWNSGRSAQISGTVKPGDVIWYKITVTNGGGAAASSVSVSDPLPAQVTLDGTTPYEDDGSSSPSWSLSQATASGVTTVTGTLTSLAASASRYFWIKTTVK